MKRYIIGVTGASGSILAKRLLGYMAGLECEIHVVLTEMGKKVFEFETKQNLNTFLDEISGKRAKIQIYDSNDLFASIASGSFATDAMIVLPCSMSTVAKIATGTGGNLLCRAADVCIKEKTRLVISPREAPLSSIHLRNLLTLSDCGAVIIPPVPMFYSNHTEFTDIVDGIIGRILKSAGVDNELYTKWTNGEAK